MKKVVLFLFLLCAQLNYAQSLEWVIKPNSDKIDLLGKMFRITQNGKSGLCDFNGKWVLPKIYDEIPANGFGNAVAKQINKNKLFYLPNDSTIIDLGTYEEVRLPMIIRGGVIPARKGKYWGLISYNAKKGWIIEPKFDNIEDFYWVHSGKDCLADAILNGKTVQIDTLGTVVIPEERNNINTFGGRFGTGTSGGKRDLVVPFTHNYKSIATIDYPPTYYLVQNDNRKYGIVGLDGTVLVEPKYSSFEYFKPTRTIAKERKNNNIETSFLIDVKTGKELAIYDQIWESTRESSNFFCKKDGLMGLIDSSGQVLLTATHQNIELINNNYLKTQKGLWNVVNYDGKVIFPFIFDEISWSGDKILCVKYQGKWGVVKIP